MPTINGQVILDDDELREECLDRRRPAFRCADGFCGNEDCHRCYSDLDIEEDKPEITDELPRHQ